MNARNLLAGVLLSIIVAGCGDSSGVCGQLYDDSKACWLEDLEKRKAEGDFDEDEDGLPTRSEFISICKASMRKHKDEIDEEAKCAKEPTCDEARACKEKASSARYAKKQVKDIGENVAKAKWEDAFSDCRYMPEEPHPDLLAACERVFTEGMPALVAGGKAEDVRNACSYSVDLKKKAPSFAKACVGVMSAELEIKKKAAIAARDAATDDNYLQCSELRSVAEGVGEEAKKEAETLCSEMQIASSAKQALTEARTNIDTKQSSVSYYCTSALDSLGMLEPKSDWAKKTTDELIKVCFIDSGKMIVDVVLASEYPYCDYALTQVRDAISKYSLTGKDPEFDKAIAKTDKICAR